MRNENIQFYWICVLITCLFFRTTEPSVWPDRRWLTGLWCSRPAEGADVTHACKHHTLSQRSQSFTSLMMMNTWMKHTYVSDGPAPLSDSSPSTELSTGSTGAERRWRHDSCAVTLMTRRHFKLSSVTCVNIPLCSIVSVTMETQRFRHHPPLGWSPGRRGQRSGCSQKSLMASLPVWET